MEYQWQSRHGGFYVWRSYGLIHNNRELGRLAEIPDFVSENLLLDPVKDDWGKVINQLISAEHCSVLIQMLDGHAGRSSFMQKEIE